MIVYLLTVEDTLELNVTTLNDSETCITSKCNQGCKISIVDRFSCTDYINIDQNATKRSCISLATLHSVMDMACAPYHVKVDSGNMTIYSTSIMEVQGYY